MVNHTKGLAPTLTFSYGPDLCPRGLDPMIHGGQTLGTPLGGYILEFTYPQGLGPLLITGYG